jgi:hypothetical protein
MRGFRLRSWKVATAKAATALGLLAGLGCGGDGGGPTPAVHLVIRGQVLSTDASPVPVAANVALRDFEGLVGDPVTLAQTTADQAGRYQLTYTLTSQCGPQDNTTYWIEATAQDYQTALTLSLPDFSDPVIYCTDEPQVIDLRMQAFGAMQVITSTNNPVADPDGYALIIDGLLPNNSVEYPLEPNDELVLPDVLPGEYTLELTELAPSCVVAGENRRTVAVAARDTAVTAFDVTCGP